MFTVTLYPGIDLNDFSLWIIMEHQFLIVQKKRGCCTMKEE